MAPPLRNRAPADPIRTIHRTIHQNQTEDQEAGPAASSGDEVEVASASGAGASGAGASAPPPESDAL